MFLSLRLLTVKLASAEPWAMSSATTRKKFLCGFSAAVPRSGFVADGLTRGMFAGPYLLWAALVAPENAGPTIATRFLSEMAIWASVGAICGFPWSSRNLALRLNLRPLVEFHFATAYW